MGLSDRSLSAGITNSERMYGGRAYDDELSEKYDGHVSDALGRNAGRSMRKFQTGGSARVYIDKEDEALQGRLENTNSPFQLALQDAESTGQSQFEFDMGDGRGPLMYAARTGGAGGNAGAGATTAATTGGGGGVEADLTGLDAELEAYDATADSSVIGGGVGASQAEVQDPTWWQSNQRGVGNTLMNAASGFASIAPNIANINDYHDLPGIRSPNLQHAVTSEAPSMEATRQAIKAQGRNASQRGEGQSANNQLAANAAAMSGTQSALSRLGGQEAQVEAQTNARNAQAQNQVNRSNVYTLNKHQNEMNSRDMAKVRGIAGERAAIGNKTLGFMGDIRNQKLDRERMDLIGQQYANSGVLERAQVDFLNKNGYLPGYGDNKNVG
jgi:hypothetical protein